MGAHYCPACGFETKGAPFCSSCGASTAAPRPTEAWWVGPVVWGLFLGGIAVAVVGAGTIVALVGVVMLFLGFGGIIASGRVMPGGRRR